LHRNRGGHFSTFGRQIITVVNQNVTNTEDDVTNDVGVEHPLLYLELV
jgi:hypothetical protein